LRTIQKNCMMLSSWKEISTFRIAGNLFMELVRVTTSLARHFHVRGLVRSAEFELMFWRFCVCAPVGPHKKHSYGKPVGCVCAHQPTHTHESLDSYGLTCTVDQLRDALKEMKLKPEKGKPSMTNGGKACDALLVDENDLVQYIEMGWELLIPNIP